MPISANWSVSDIPKLEEKTVIVTGGNKGLGYQSVLALSKQQANLVIACRSLEAGLDAKRKILNDVPGAKISVMPLDLTDPGSIHGFSETFKEKYTRLDILMLNAGAVNLETYQLTSAGHEMHMATNHLGHFALTGKLFHLLKNTDNARVVTLTSLAYKSGVIDIGDFSWQKRKYDRFKAYADSKLANLLFTSQLQQRFERSGASAIAVSAHPGLTATQRQQSIGIGGAFARWIASPVSKGCLPQLLAATEPAVRSNDFYGPKYGLFGAPRRQKVASKLFAQALAEKLWKYSEQLTGVHFGEA